MYKGDLRCYIKCSNPEAFDQQSHILHCETIKAHLSTEEQIEAQETEYAHIYGSLEQQKKVAVVLSRLLEIREELLEQESLPMGEITGPISTITVL